MFIANSITTEVITITPRIAHKLLEQNTRNRKISKQQLAKIVRAFELGEWELNGEAIKIAKNGKILDGQHRLTACAEMGTPFETLIVYGLDDETQKTMDTGKSRTISDVLAIEGYKDPTNLASITAAIIRYERWGMKAGLRSGTSAYAVTAGEALDRIISEPTLTELSGLVSGPQKIGLPRKTGGLLYYAFSNLDPHDTDYFFEKLATGAALERGNPILALRNSITSMKSDVRGQVNQLHVGALAIKSWNKFRDGDEVKVLSFRPGGATPEAFPTPH